MTDALAWAGTFHGIGARLLREYAEQIGLDPAFTIHDREDSADLMNLLRHQLGLSKTESRFPTKGTCLAIYSRAVNAQLALGEVLGGVYPWCAGWEIRLRELFALYVEAATGATSRMKLKLSFSYSVALMASFEPDKSSVYPSAGACTTASTAILPLPPVRFSMRNCRPSRSDSNCPIKRAMMSHVPPAAKPTMMWTGRAG
jgi:hypothetical protein